MADDDDDDDNYIRQGYGGSKVKFSVRENCKIIKKMIKIAWVSFR